MLVLVIVLDRIGFTDVLPGENEKENEYEYEYENEYENVCVVS